MTFIGIPAALIAVSLDRLRLAFLVTGVDQVLTGLRALDAFALGLVAFPLLSLAVVLGVLRGNRWWFVLALFLLTANLVASGPHRLNALANPYDLSAWTWSLVVLAANIMGVVIAMAALPRGFGYPVPAHLTEITTRLLRYGGAGLGGMVILAGILTTSEMPYAAAEVVPYSVVQVDMIDLNFVPADVKVPHGEPVALYLINRDRTPHTFTVDGLGLHISVPPRSTVHTIVELQLRGDFDLYCSVPGHQTAGHIGTVRVR